MFWPALGNNILWTLVFLTIPILMGLLAASMLLIVRKGSNVFQVIYFLPVIIATAITARVWQGMIYSPVTGIFGILIVFHVSASADWTWSTCPRAGRAARLLSFGVESPPSRRQHDLPMHGVSGAMSLSLQC